MSNTGCAVLNDAKREVVCAILSKGGTLAEAASYIGCAVRTLQRELHRNQQFRDEVSHAKAQGALAPFQVMRKAAGSNWRAASWMIERADAKRRSRSPIVPVQDVAIRQPSGATTLREHPRLAADRHTEAVTEITPEFEEFYPRLAAFALEHRARRSAAPSAASDPPT